MKRLLIIVFLQLFLSGCAFYWNPETKAIAWKPEKQPYPLEIKAEKNKRNLARLERGMTRNDIIDLMGIPDLSAHYESVEDKETDLYYYYTRAVADDGAPAREECTPLVITDNKLTGWGNTFYANYKKPDYLKSRR